MKKTKSFSYAKYGYLFSIPFVVAYLIFSLYPTINTVILGFTDAKGMAGLTNWHFLPADDLFKNFIAILKAPTFRKSLGWPEKLPHHLGLRHCSDGVFLYPHRLCPGCL